MNVHLASHPAARPARRLHWPVPVALWSGVLSVTLLSFGMHMVNAQEQRAARSEQAVPQPADDEQATLAAVEHASPGTAR